MARRKPRVSVSEIEALRRRLGEANSTGVGLPDEILRKFGRLLAVAYDLARQDEAVQLATELYQFHEELQRAEQRQKSTGPVQVNVRLEPPLLIALDMFMAEQERACSREKAVTMLLKDALKEHGLLPLEEQPPIKRDAS